MTLICGKCNGTKYNLRTIAMFELKVCAHCGTIMHELKEKQNAKTES